MPAYGFEYTFLDDEIQAVFSEMKGQSQMFFIISILAIAIGCLGIFGMVSYTARQRTREIGVRKVLGSSVAQIVGLLSKEFVLLIVIANALAMPIGYIMMQDMLSYEAIKVDIGIGTYLSVLSMSILFGLGTAGIQAVKAALANPIEALRYE